MPPFVPPNADGNPKPPPPVLPVVVDGNPKPEFVEEVEVEEEEEEEPHGFRKGSVLIVVDSRLLPFEVEDESDEEEDPICAADIMGSCMSR